MNEKPINSRSLDDLHPRVRAMAVGFIAKAKEAGFDLLITSTLRNNAAQAELFAQGRTKPGRIVTNARPGESTHNYGLALDVVPMLHGKCLWDSKGWPEIGRIGESVGLEWSGRWTGKFRELAHFGYYGGLNIADLKAGKTFA